MTPTPDGWPRLSTSLFYDDAKAAIDFLCRAFGFEVRMLVEGDDGQVQHSELTFGEALLMVGSSRSNPHGDPLPMVSPRQTQGLVTQAACLFVDDVDAHCERARQAGSTIGDDPVTHDYGDDYCRTPRVVVHGRGEAGPAAGVPANRLAQQPPIADPPPGVPGDPDAARWQVSLQDAITKSANACGYDTEVLCEGFACAVVTDVTVSTSLLSLVRRPHLLLERFAAEVLNAPGIEDSCSRTVREAMDPHGHIGDVAVPPWEDSRLCVVWVPPDRPRWASSMHGHVPPLCSLLLGEPAP